MTMAHDLVVPKLGLTMEEASILEWHRADGDAIAKGEPLYTVETEKVAYDVEADADGYLQRVAAVDDVLPIGGLVGRLHATAEAALRAARGEAPDAPAAAAAAAPAPRDAVAPVEAPIEAPARIAAIETATSASAPAEAAPAVVPAVVPIADPVVALRTGTDDGRQPASPVARRLAEAKSVDLAAVRGSGPGGAVLKRDVEAAARAAPAADRPRADAPAAQARRPLAGMRRTISQRMMASLHGSAQMTAFGRVDMAQAVALRQRLADDAERLGARVTYTDLVLKCIAATLAEMPQLNAWIEGDEIVSSREIDLGLAVALDDGLVVPVIRHVDRLSLVELSLARRAAIDKARGGRLAAEDSRGGGFTLSNFGSYGGDFETPILNPPQSAMLGIGRIADEVVAHQGAVAIRPMMWISMTFDHRLIDGAVAGRFRSRLKALLEEPTRLLATMR